MKDKKIFIIWGIGLVIVIIILGVMYLRNNIKIKEFDNGTIKLSYDSTWKVIGEEEEFKLEHKKTKSILSIQCKEIDEKYLSTSLSDIISDIVYDIEEQNSDYKLINVLDNTYTDYDSASYLYENDENQVLVTIFKKDAMLVITYFEAPTNYYDIVLDSVDTVLNSIQITTGEKLT